eukprot:6712561-Pyramimonas_sp.AAC.1
MIDVLASRMPCRDTRATVQAQTRPLVRSSRSYRSAPCAAALGSNYIQQQVGDPYVPGLQLCGQQHMYAHGAPPMQLGHGAP